MTDKKKIIVSASIDRVVVDRDGEGKVTFAIPQEHAADLAVLSMMTHTDLQLTIEERETMTHGKRK